MRPCVAHLAEMLERFRFVPGVVATFHLSAAELDVIGLPFPRDWPRMDLGAMPQEAGKRFLRRAPGVTRFRAKSETHVRRRQAPLEEWRCGKKPTGFLSRMDVAELREEIDTHATDETLMLVIRRCNLVRQGTGWRSQYPIPPFPI